MRSPGESCAVTCPSGDAIRGRVTFSGGVWFRPDYRKAGLTSILGRVLKATAFTRWYTDIMLTMMIDQVYDDGTGRRAGYPHCEWAVEFKNTPVGNYKLALLWMTTPELLAYFEEYLAKSYAKVDAIVENRTA
jgi:hypothetical protein